MTKSIQPRISIVTPTLNEAGNIRNLIHRIDAAMKLGGYTYELIVIDDHSSDTTVRIARKLSAEYPVRVQLKRGPRGKAQSLLEGFAIASYELVAMIDADLQYPPEALPEMVMHLQKQKLDVVLTRRQVNETSAIRKASSAAFHLVFARLLHGVGFDSQSGLKLFKRSLIERMELRPSPWNFDLEFIVRARQLGAKFGEVAIVFAARTEGEAKISLTQAAIETAVASIRFKAALVREHMGVKELQS